jgi:hypothetical protein
MGLTMYKIYSTLLFAIFLSSLPQVVRIVRLGRTEGIATWFPVFGSLYSNIQLAESLILCARAWPSDEYDEPVLVLIGYHRLRGIAAVGAILGVAQVALQWAYTFAM